jgi:hypothetical protein
MSFMRSAGIKSTWASFLEVLVFFCVISVVFFLLCNVVFFAVANPTSRKADADELQAALDDNARAATTLVDAMDARAKALAAATAAAVTSDGSPATETDATDEDAEPLSDVELAIKALPDTPEATALKRDLEQANRWQNTSIDNARNNFKNSAGMMLTDPTDRAKVLDDLAQQIGASTDTIEGQLTNVLMTAVFLSDEDVQKALQPMVVDVYDVTDIVDDGRSIEGLDLGLPEQEPTRTPLEQAVKAPPTHLGEAFAQLLSAYAQLDTASAAILANTNTTKAGIKAIADRAQAQGAGFFTTEALDKLQANPTTDWAPEFNKDLLNYRGQAAQMLADAKPDLDAARQAAIAPAQAVRDAAALTRDQINSSDWLNYSAEADLQKQLLELAARARELRGIEEVVQDAPAPSVSMFRKQTMTLALSVTQLTPMLTQADVRAGLDASTDTGADAPMAACLAEATALQALLADNSANVDVKGLASRADEFAKDVANAAKAAQTALDERHQAKGRELGDQLLRIEDAAKQILNRLNAVEGASLDAVEPQVTPGQGTGASISQGLAAIHVDRKFSGSFPFVRFASLFTGLPWWMWVIEFILYILLLTVYWAPSDDREINLCELRAFMMFVLVATVLAVIMLEVSGQWVSQPMKLFFQILFTRSA